MRPYIDCHNHIGRTLDRAPKVGQNTGMCLSRFAETSVYAAITMPTAVGSPIARGVEDIRHQNRVIARAREDFPERFPLGLALVEPRFGERGIEEAEWAMSELGLDGIVGHPPISEWCLPYVEAVAARGGLCNLHLQGELMERIAREFPEAQFIVHASTWAAENLADFDNVWFEVVQYPDERGSEWDFEWLAEKVGRDRLLFGGDLPYYDYRFLQEKIEEAPIDDDFKNRIAHGNITDLIQHYNPDWEPPAEPVTAPRDHDAEELWASDPEKPDRLTVLA